MILQENQAKLAVEKVEIAYKHFYPIQSTSIFQMLNKSLNKIFLKYKH